MGRLNDRCRKIGPQHVWLSHLLRLVSWLLLLSRKSSTGSQDDTFSDPIAVIDRDPVACRERQVPSKFLYFARSPETFCEFFVACLPGNFALKNGGDFW